MRHANWNWSGIVFHGQRGLLMRPVKRLTICHISLECHFVANYRNEYVASEWVNVGPFDMAAASNFSLNYMSNLGKI